MFKHEFFMKPKTCPNCPLAVIHDVFPAVAPPPSVCGFQGERIHLHEAVGREREHEVL